MDVHKTSQHAQKNKKKRRCKSRRTTKKRSKKNMTLLQQDSSSQSNAECRLLNKKDEYEVLNSSSAVTLDPKPNNFNLSTKSSTPNEVWPHELTLHQLFDHVYSGEMIPTLPNRSWSIHYIEVPARCIVISQLVIHYEIDMGLIPIHIKQIVFDEQMDYELFFFNAKASTSKPYVVQTFTDMMNVITFVNDIRLCIGGPKTVLHANVNLECAYRDLQGRWRHNLCTLEVTDCSVCEPCLSLLTILQRNNKRNKSLHKSKSDETQK